MRRTPQIAAQPAAPTSSSPNTTATSKAFGRPLVSRAQQRRSMVASITGQLLEWYEWSVYAVFAPFIAQALFDPDDTAASLLATFGVFAVGFLFRPLGGIVFGRIADKKGRRFVLVTTMLAMAAGSILIGVLPGYESIGTFAAVLLLLARIVQGFAHGGESATANSYIAELAPAQRRGLWGSAVFMTIFGGAILAFAVGAAVTGFLSAEAVQAWGWRIPFLLGAVLAAVALWLRVGMIESQVYADSAPADGLDASQYSNSTLAPLNRGFAILLIFFLVSGVAASNYTWTSYISTYAITTQGMDAKGAFWALLGALLIGLAALPAWGAVSDRIGRKPVLYIFTISIAVLTFPLKAAITSAPWTLFLSAAIALICLAAGASLLTSVMAETFPTRTRTTHIGLAYSLATVVFGGTMPYVNQFAQYVGLPWLADGFIVFAALLALFAAFRLPERKGIDLSIVR